MRKLIDRAARRLGYVRSDSVLQGTVEFKINERPFVDLTLPGALGYRLHGWVDNGAPAMAWPSPSDSPVVMTDAEKLAAVEEWLHPGLWSAIDGRREALGRILAGDPVAPPSWCRG
ncbi:hypothetical protein SEA_CAIN_91 [Mycobacterium phage Cain]|nr:hypothetical protein SEA_PHRANK_91 [Mycobacterium phage Phrank]ASR85490.1 hypothetical protein SEA_CAIN_91 [Mycobacterium phage Cain]